MIILYKAADKHDFTATLLSKYTHLTFFKKNDKIENKKRGLLFLAVLTIAKLLVVQLERVEFKQASILDILSDTASLTYKNMIDEPK